MKMLTTVLQLFFIPNVIIFCFIFIKVIGMEFMGMALSNFMIYFIYTLSMFIFLLKNYRAQIDNVTRNFEKKSTV